MDDRPRRLIYHRDLWGLEYYEAPLDVRDFIWDYVGRISGTPVDTFVLHMTYNLFPTRLTVEEFVSQNGEPVGLEGDHATWAAPGELSASSWRKLENERFFKRENIDPVDAIMKAAHGAGMDFFAGVRMNDAHHAQYNWHPKFWVEHPECLIGDHPEYRFPRVGFQESGGTFKNQHDDRVPACLDFMRPEVRDYRQAYILEIPEKYPDVDGIELDFTRHPFYFKPREVESGRQVMSEFLVRLRANLLSKARTRGRPIVLEARVPPTLASCLRIGLDVRGWMADGLVDIVTPAPYWHPDFGMPIEDFVNAAKGKACKVFAGIECAEMPVLESAEATAEMLRAAAFAYWSVGVDGMHVFNTHVFPYYLRQEMLFLSEIGDPRLLECRDKRYMATRSSNYDDVAWFSYPKELPAVLTRSRPGSGATVHIRVGDDFRRTERSGRWTVVLRVRVQNLTRVDQLEVKMNGALLAADRFVSTFYPLGESAALRQYSFLGDNYFGLPGPYHWMECTLEGDSLPVRGVNTVEVRLIRGNPEVTTAVTLSDVEILVRRLKREGVQVAGTRASSA